MQVRWLAGESTSKGKHKVTCLLLTILLSHTPLDIVENRQLKSRPFDMLVLKEWEPVSGLTCAWLAQSVEHETLNLRVVGSSPTLGANFFQPKF